MKGLLGFAVLTGPLWLIFLLFTFGGWLGFKVTKLSKSAMGKVALGLGTFVLVLFLPFADEIAGQLYLSYLCATKAGVKVYQTVELPAEYWDERGEARFFNKYGYLDRTFSAERISKGDGRVERYSSLLPIDKDLFKVAERKSHTLLGEVTTFRFWGGRISRNFNPGGPSASDCERLHGSQFWHDFYSSLFTRPPSSRR